ncbi:enoyl-CoA hydratase/isomerase family protein [Marinivivus vitaminiproducens]|uniref:enoyl-CoA hydratase/isomerase family protein n=1 Tax=Marinivivus vitaminiproducens TaxID=3035935 RepID=UPI0027A0F383|nr:enoyl-CoA hydratase/isomerase family protein [Geminicoccaceae bacterium SCSIO 64248]
MADGIHFDRQGRLGAIVLDQPKSLNALTHPMVLALGRQLARWRRDDDVAAVLIKGAGERAFCAGGDIKRVHRLRQEGEADLTRFFRDEYRMNWRIDAFEKPYVALIDGVTMGGGVGVSAPADLRIATERTLFAMPETTIGFFPDVGGTAHLARLPGALGRYLGLTGHRLTGAECLAVGLATHVVPSGRLAELEDALVGAAGQNEPLPALRAAADAFAVRDGDAPIRDRLDAIDRIFGASSLDGVLQALADEPDGWAREQREALAAKSPTSLRLTWAQLERGSRLDFAGALRQEYRMVHRCMAGHDFFEGVRALLVDKDRTPKWRPATLGDVADGDIDAYFAVPPGGDLTFDWDEAG